MGMDAGERKRARMFKLKALCPWGDVLGWEMVGKDKDSRPRQVHESRRRERN